jgi:hypothetical protein
MFRLNHISAIIKCYKSKETRYTELKVFSKIHRIKVLCKILSKKYTPSKTQCAKTDLSKYKVAEIWPGQTVTCLHTNSPGHILTTFYILYFSHATRGMESVKMKRGYWNRAEWRTVNSTSLHEFKRFKCPPVIGHKDWFSMTFHNS